MDVARGAAPADRVLRGGRVLNVFTGELERADVVIACGRVVGLAEDPVHADDVVSVEGLVLCPGLVEAHCHPDLLYDPWSLGEAVRARGTTTVCADLLTLLVHLDDELLVALTASLSMGPVHYVWALRTCLDGDPLQEASRLAETRLLRLMDRLTDLVSIGEVTGWRELLTDDARLAPVIEEAERRGLRINGHLPGASATTLTVAALCGLTDDHEAVNGTEVLARLRAGYWTMVRQSSLRPDLGTLVSALVAADVPMERVLFTTDGPVAGTLQEGHLDRLISVAVQAGLEPIEAVRCATLRPATYLGLDAHLGSLGPGRLADVVAVEDLSQFDVQRVWVGGQEAGPSSDAYETLWEARAGGPLAAAPLTAERLRAVCHAGPVLRLEGIITRVAGPEVPATAAYVALVARDGRWIVGAMVGGLAAGPLVSAFTGSGDILLLGPDPVRLMEIYRRMVAVGPGVTDGTVEIPLDRAGILSSLPVAALADLVRQIAAPWRFEGGTVPLEFLSLFLTLGVLPDVRLTPIGVFDVRHKSVMVQPVFLTG